MLDSNILSAKHQFDLQIRNENLGEWRIARARYNLAFVVEHKLNQLALLFQELPNSRGACANNDTLFVKFTLSCGHCPV